MSDSAAPSSRSVPVREDCWSQDASKTLVEAWGRRYVELNRGNLRQKDWQQVADIVNARHGHTKKTYRTDVQCKNRIDTIKKKYKVEKARVSESGGMVGSSWPFFDRLDELIGSNLKKPSATSGGGSAAVSVSVSESLSYSPPMALPLPHSYRTSAAPLATAALSKKRTSPAADDSYFRRNYSAVAAAAAAASTSSEDDDGEEGDEVEVEVRAEDGEEEEILKGCRGKERSEDGIMKLAMAIKKFGDVYAKVEAEKQNQMVEMERQRIQFTKDLEVQRMQMYVNMQLQLKKIKIAKANKSNGESS